MTLVDKIWHNLFHEDTLAYGSGCELCDKERIALVFQGVDEGLLDWISVSEVLKDINKHNAN